MAIKSPAADLVDRLVYANRILYDQNIVDGLGHASVRHDSEPGAFLLSCNRAPGMVRRQDITASGDDLFETTALPDAARLRRRWQRRAQARLQLTQPPAQSPAQ